MKYVTQKGLDDIRTRAERALARHSRNALIPVLPLLALLDDVAAQQLAEAWRPVRFQQSMTCPACKEAFDIVVTAMMRGNETTWIADLAAQQLAETDAAFSICPECGFQNGHLAGCELELAAHGGRRLKTCPDCGCQTYDDRCPKPACMARRLAV